MSLQKCDQYEVTLYFTAVFVLYVSSADMYFGCVCMIFMSLLSIFSCLSVCLSCTVLVHAALHGLKSADHKKEIWSLVGISLFPV